MKEFLSFQNDENDENDSSESDGEGSSKNCGK
jgi:hypothetical protein